MNVRVTIMIIETQSPSPESLLARIEQAAIDKDWELYEELTHEFIEGS